MRCHPAILALAPLALFARGVAADGPAVADAVAVHRLSAPLRDGAAPLARQLAAVRALAATGDAGAKAWHDHVDRVLARLAAVVDARPHDTAIDREIETLRGTLADLRADPDLTKEKLEQQGLPALEKLRAAVAQRDTALKPWRTKQAAARAQAERLIALVEACRDAATADPALAAAGPFDVAAARELAARLGPEDAAAAGVLAENGRIAKTLPPEVAAGTRAVDSVRMLCGLAPLVIDPKLCVAATGHSADMEAHNFFAHESPLPGKREPWDRAKLAGTTAAAENIYMGTASGTDAVKAWFLSPGHHKNLLADGHVRQGLGCSGNHWTQLFGD
ncbi:MAG: CAP domain-containing protein [Planctomycetaceae bacterium]